MVRGDGLQIRPAKARPGTDRARRAIAVARLSGGAAALAQSARAVGRRTLDSRGCFLREPARQIRVAAIRGPRRWPKRRNRGAWPIATPDVSAWTPCRSSTAGPEAKVGDQFNYRRNQDGSLHKGSTEALPRAEFEALLDQVETQLTEMGRAIFAGEATVDPYRKGAETPCQFCDYRSRLPD